MKDATRKLDGAAYQEGSEANGQRVKTDARPESCRAPYEHHSTMSPKSRRYSSRSMIVPCEVHRRLLVMIGRSQERNNAVCATFVSFCAAVAQRAELKDMNTFFVHRKTIFEVHRRPPATRDCGRRSALRRSRRRRRSRGPIDMLMMSQALRSSEDTVHRRG